MVGLSALLLAACGGGMGGGAGAGPSPQVMRPVPNAGYDAWVAAFRPRAEAKGISQATLATAFRSAGFLPDVIDKDRNPKWQPATIAELGEDPGFAAREFVPEAPLF